MVFFTPKERLSGSLRFSQNNYQSSRVYPRACQSSQVLSGTFIRERASKYQEFSVKYLKTDSREGSNIWCEDLISSQCSYLG